MSVHSLSGRWLITALAVAVLASRLLLLPGAPISTGSVAWSVAAAAALDEVAPQQASPLWIVAARAARLVGNVALGLQLLAALAAALTVLLAARLWCDVFPDEVAVGGALLLAAAPGLWRTSLEGGPDPAAALLAAVAVLAWRRLGPARWLAGCLLTALAALAWPPLALPLAVLVLLAGWLRRESGPRLLLGVAVFIAVVAVGLALLFARMEATGLWREALLGGGLAPPGWVPVGTAALAQGFGGAVATALAVLLAGFGMAAALAERQRLAIAWATMSVVVLAWFHLNPSFHQAAAAWAPATLLCAPAVAGLARLLRRPVLALVLCAAVAAVVAVAIVPALAQAANVGEPSIAAVLAARGSSDGGAVLVSDGVKVAAEQLAAAYPRGPIVLALDAVLDDGALRRSVPAPFSVVWREDEEVALLPGARTEIRRFPCPPSLEDCVPVLLAERPALLVAGDGPARAPDEFQLLLPATPRGSWIGFELEIAGAPAALELSIDGRATGAATFAPGHHRVHVPVPPAGGSERTATSATLRRSGPDAGDVVLRRAWVEQQSKLQVPIEIAAAALAGPGAVAESGGLHDLEILGEPPRPGRWSAAEAWLNLPSAGGVLMLELAAPRPDPARVGIRVEPSGWRGTIDVGPGWRTVTIPLRNDQARVWIHLVTENPFVPGGADRRELGVVLGRVTITPE